MVRVASWCREALRRLLGGQRWLTLPLLGAMVTAAWWDIDPQPLLRNRGFDVLQRLAPTEPASGRIVLLDIDEPSLARLGQFPWSRSVQAEIVRRLTEAGAVIGLGILFAEPDRTSPDQLVLGMPDLPEEAMRALAAQPRPDRLFADALKAGRVVLASAVGAPERQRPPRGVALVTINGMREMVARLAPQLSGTVEPLPALASAAAGVGVLAMAVDDDGVLRRLPTLLTRGNEVVPAFWIELLRVAEEQERVAARLGPAGLDALVVPPQTVIPTNGRGYIRPRFATLPPQRRSLVRLLDMSLAPGALAGRIVVIGASAAGLAHPWTTPVGRMLDHEVVAVTLDNLLAGRLLLRPGWTPTAEVLAILGAGLILIVGGAWLGTAWLLGLWGALTVAAAATAWLAFAQLSHLIDATGLALALAALMVVMLAGRALPAPTAERAAARDLEQAERRRRRAVTRLQAAESELVAAEGARQRARSRAREQGLWLDP